MKYRIIKISPNIDGNDWTVDVWLDDTDRKNTKQKPSNHGWYYAKQSEPTEVAVEKLKKVMIEYHEREIKNLKKSLAKLKKLKYLGKKEERLKVGR